VDLILYETLFRTNSMAWCHLIAVHLMWTQWYFWVMCAVVGDSREPSHLSISLQKWDRKNDANENLMSYVFHAAVLHVQYLLTTCCTVCIFVINYCSVFQWQFPAIFRELASLSTYKLYMSVNLLPPWRWQGIMAKTCQSSN